MVFFEVRRALDGASLVDVRDDLAGLLGGVVELHQRLGHGVVDDLDDAAADQLLVLDECEVGLNAGGVAIHHEADCASGSEHGDLGILVAELFAVSEGGVPGFLGGQEELGLNALGLDAANGITMHADHFQHGLLVHLVAWERTFAFRDARRLCVGFAAHQRGDGAGNVAAFVGVVGEGHGHQQGAEIGIAKAQRTESVGVFGDTRRGIAGVVYENLLRGDGDIDGVLEGFHIEFAVGAEILHKVQRGQVARGVVQEHVLGARVRGIDARGVPASVPAIDGGVVLHARIAAMPGGVGNLE